MIKRSSISARLTQFFFKDYKAVMKQYEIEEQIEFTKYLQNIFNIYLEGEETVVEKAKWMNGELERLKKKYGKNFKAYRSGQLHKYFHFDMILAEKEIYTTEEYNKLEEQSLSEEERKSFLTSCSNGLQHSLDELYLECEPESSTIAVNGTKDARNAKGYKKRAADDKRTCLSQFQTVLLMYYLQQEKVILRDEFLTDMDAGKAFEILTGYSQHTLRQNFSKFHLYQTKPNLKEIDNLLTRLKIAIGKDLKGN